MTALVPRLVRRVRRLRPRGAVLCYHRINGPRPDPAQLDTSAAHFAEHLAVLRAHAVPLSLLEFERLRRAGALPERAVAVTFDDGYADNLHTALPLLEEHQVPAEVFVTTAGPAMGDEFWWDGVARACVQAERPAELTLTADGETRVWKAEVTRGDADAMYGAIAPWLRPKSAEAQRGAARAMLAWAGLDTTTRDSHRPLTVDELQRLAASPLIGIGSHTVTHPMLGRLSRAAQVTECVESRETLRRWLGRAPVTLAYPFGDGDAVTPEVERTARGAGYTVSLTTVAQAAWRGNRAQAVPRIAMQDWDGAEFARRLALWFNE